MGDDIFGVLLTVVLLGGERVLRRRRVRADLRAPRPARGARRTGQAQRGHGDPGRREPVADAGGRAAGHHGLLDPAGPGRRTGGGASAGSGRSTCSACPTRCCTRCRSSSRSRSSWCCTCCSARWCRRTSRSPGPESAAMLLVPPYLLWVRLARPRHRVLRLVRQHDAARAAACEPKDRTREHRLDGRAVRDDRRVAVRGTARPGGTQPAVAGAADPQPGGRRRCRSRSSEVHAVPVGRRRRAHGRRDPAGAGRDRLLPVPGRRWRRPVHRLRAHQGRACRWSTTPTRSSTVDGPAAAAEVPDRCRCPTRCRGCGAATATWRWSPADDGGVTAMVALEDLVEDLVGTVRDGTHRA